jgi:hypothetical protein
LAALVPPARAQDKPEKPKIVFELEKPAPRDNSSPFVFDTFGKTCNPFDLRVSEHSENPPWNKSASILEAAGAPIDVIKIRRYGSGWKNRDDVQKFVAKLLKAQTMEFSRYEPWDEAVFADIFATVQYSDHSEGVLEVSNVHVCFSDHSRHALWLRVFPLK